MDGLKLLSFNLKLLHWGYNLIACHPLLYEPLLSCYVFVVGWCPGSMSKESCERLGDLFIK